MPAIPWFENFLPGLAGTFSVLGVNQKLTASQRAYQRIAYPSVGGPSGGFADYTFRQLQWDDAPTSLINNLFVHPQYAALTTWTTIAKSNYHSGQITLTERLRQDVVFDLNYTIGHSLDNASGLQSAGNYSTASLIFNPLDLDSQYARPACGLAGPKLLPAVSPLPVSGVPQCLWVLRAVRVIAM